MNNQTIDRNGVDTVAYLKGDDVIMFSTAVKDT